MKSPFTKLSKIPFGDCQWTTGFWAEKFKICEETMVPYMGELLCGEVGHALNNFKIAAGLMEGEHKGMFWHDGDFYKWIEASCYIYAQNNNQELLQQLDNYISIIAMAQQEDGYIQTQIQLRPEVGRYENRKYHEMYNTGHLLISAVIHHNVTGQDNFLTVAIRQADLLHSLFFLDTEKYGRFGFNQTQIMGLVELYRITGNKKYLDLAEKFINRRGAYPVVHDRSTVGYPIGDMVQERIPLREAKEAAGHAVLALYYYAGAADVYAETGETALIESLDRLWYNVTTKKMYITGAVGQTHYGASSNRDKIEEGFIDDYMMPNLTAYNETCANICNAIFSYRMLEIHGQSKYADIMELVMFNSGLSGINIEGNSYFYANPLRMIRNARSYKDHENATESADREPYLECFCCPPNLVRTIAKVSSWAYSIHDDGLAVNFYGGNTIETHLTDGSKIKLNQESLYPWNGDVSITIEDCRSNAFSLWLRIPDWATDTSVLINGKAINDECIPGEYLRIHREWQKGDEIKLSMVMHIQLMEGHARIEEVRNQIAVKRGPIVYCIESPDLPAATSITDVYLLESDIREAEFCKDLLGGVTVVQTFIYIRETKTSAMYQKVDKPVWKKYKTRLVPYFAWSNRGTADMTVFIPVIWGEPNLTSIEITELEAIS